MVLYDDLVIMDSAGFAANVASSKKVKRYDAPLFLKWVSIIVDGGTTYILY